MNNEQSAAAAAAPPARSGVMAFFEGLLTLVLCLLMAVGLVALTATFRSSTVEFIGADRLRVTQMQWWGLASNESLYRASGSGWLRVRDNGDEVNVTTQPILPRD